MLTPMNRAGGLPASVELRMADEGRLVARTVFNRGGGGTLPVLLLGAVKVVSFFYAQPAGRISEVLIGIFKGKPMLPFDAG